MSPTTAPTTGRPHGTRNRYSLDGCRCEPCRQARRDYDRHLHYRRVNGQVAANRVTDYARMP